MDCCEQTKSTHVWFSTVALFSVLHKAVATLFTPNKVLHVGHVVQTHAPSLLEVAVQVSFTAATEDSRERMSAHRGVHSELMVIIIHCLMT